jgi:hypothetical protein
MASSDEVDESRDLRVKYTNEAGNIVEALY